MGSLVMLMGGLAVPMGGLARNVPGRGKNLWHRTSRTSTDFSVWLVPNLGATLGVTLGVGSPKENHPDNQEVKCWVCWVLPTACQHMCAGVRVMDNSRIAVVGEASVRLDL